MRFWDCSALRSSLPSNKQGHQALSRLSNHPSSASSPAHPATAAAAAAPLPPVLPALLLPAAADISRPGGAGHALLFSDHGVVIEGFKDLGESGIAFSTAEQVPMLEAQQQRHAQTRLRAAYLAFQRWMRWCWPAIEGCPRPAAHPAAAPDAFTFEAWLSTTDFCHPSAIFSYALDSKAEVGRRTRRTAAEPVCAAGPQLEPHLLLQQAKAPACGCHAAQARPSADEALAQPAACSPCCKPCLAGPICHPSSQSQSQRTADFNHFVSGRGAQPAALCRMV